MSIICLHLDCVPPITTAQQKGERIVTGKNGKPFIAHYEKKKVKAARQLFCGLLTPHIPPVPLSGPIICECEWVFPWRASERKSLVREFTRIPKDTKPDADNSNKLLLDCMTEMGFWNDDSQVFKPIPSKWWGDQKGIWIRIISGEDLPPFPRREVML
mgnify:CR=1 FL=1